MGDPNPQAPRRKCGAMSVHQFLLEQDPGFRAAQRSLEHSHKARMRTARVARAAPVKIQTVVHIVHRTAAEDIPDAQVHSQLKVLNDDFRKRNADLGKIPPVWAGLATDAMVEFVLATKKPDGTATDGIIRKPTPRTGFGPNDKVKSAATGGSDPWDTERYLNIWVCTLSDGLLGYAQFPGGPPATDGVVILNKAFGTVGDLHAQFNRGRTATHEVGHYLNLRHIWGDDEACEGTDFCADTPNAESPNYDKPVFPKISCENGPSGDMFMNYMDYVDDDSMFMFTPDQVARMESTLDGPRSGLVT
jgi:hypothetical protein